MHSTVRPVALSIQQVSTVVVTAVEDVAVLVCANLNVLKPPKGIFFASTDWLVPVVDSAEVLGVPLGCVAHDSVEVELNASPTTDASGGPDGYAGA